MKIVVLSALCLGALLPLVSCQGGMAELKAITGDEPYNGVGNAPAPIPQPMGFWGRPRYSPVNQFQGGQVNQFQAGPVSQFQSGPYASGGWVYAPNNLPQDRFTSYGHSPYAGNGQHPFDLLSGLFSVFDDEDEQKFRPRAFAPERNVNNMQAIRPNMPSPKLGPMGPSVRAPPPPPPPAPASQPIQASGQQSLNLGGFYTGKGN